MPSTNKSRKITLMSLVILFLFAPMYVQPNMGGLGLGLPFNRSVWLVVIIFICLVLFKTFQNNHVNYNKGFIYCLSFPLVLVFVGLSSEVPMPIVWLFRQLYILCGFAYLFALFQIKLSNKEVEQLLFVIVISTFIHSLVGLCQLWQINIFDIWLPRTSTGIPIGLFQQVNLQATYLVTGLLIMLYLISRPSFQNAHFVTRLFFVLTFGIGTYIVFSSGSRVGILSFFMGNIVMLLSRRHIYFPKHKLIVCSIYAVAVLGGIAGQEGFARAIDKTEQLSSPELTSIRQTIYAVSLDVIQHKPLFGYGIASFPRVWTENIAIYAEQHPKSGLPTAGFLTHPHNEVLFWMIEGGFISVVGLIVIFVVLSVAIYRCRFSRGGAYLSLLLPISLHTQVELPFYSSSVHWFLWLFLIFIIFNHQLKSVPFKITKLSRVFMQIITLIISIVGVSIIVHADKAEKEITKYLNREESNLEIALSDIYFNDYAEKLIMQALLYTSIKNNDHEQIPLIIDWGEERLRKTPERGVFQILTDAYGFKGDIKNKCRIAKSGHAIYLNDPRLKAQAGDCF